MYVENLVSEEYKLKLQENILSESFSWNWCHSMTDDCQVGLYTHQMTIDDKIIDNETFELCKGILYSLVNRTNIKIDRILRSRINSLFSRNISEDEFEKLKHRDFENVDNKKIYSLIYYVNDSDGYNYIFEDDEKTLIERHHPKAGDAILFESNNLHSAIPPLINERRVTVVFIFSVL
jgi:hypothetical protein